jgi:hypothetical protein
MILILQIAGGVLLAYLTWVLVAAIIGALMMPLEEPKPSVSSDWEPSPRPE